MHQIDDALGQSWSDAYRLSEQHPDDLSYPWVDRAAGKVVYAAATARGASLATDRIASNGAAANTLVNVKHSRAKLQSVMDAEIGPTPEGFVISASYPEPEINRVILEVDGYSDAMLWRMAERHGGDTLAILVVELPGPIGPAPRDAGFSPFLGGTRINGPYICTAGFSWRLESVDMLVTAGHCAPSGGSFSTPLPMSVGTVASGTEENWTIGVGTVVRTGGSGYRGDVALIRAAPGRATAPYIYVGSATSGSSTPVRAMWNRSPASGDQFCTGGATKGEHCLWTTDWSAAGNYYYGLTGETARNVWRGTKRAHCIANGDSGGPVYTVHAGSGQIVAKGIISGATGFGGSDAYAGLLDAPCQAVYTDIWQVYSGFPGVLKTSPADGLSRSCGVYAR